jgi:uncharacterized pyridoxamine 5'-phosphate oxidase family protein
MEKVLAFLKDCKTFFVATVEDGNPKVRPFGFVMQFEGKLYFATGNQKPFFKQILENSNIEICGANEKYEWVRLRGKAVIDSRSVVKQRAFEAAPELAYVYQTIDNPIFECFYLEDTEARFFAMSAATGIVEL